MVDTSSLFLHVLAATGMVGGGAAQILAGSRLRAAERADELASWARFSRSAGWLILVSAFVSLATGGHLAGAVWTTETRRGFSHPFITLGVAGLLLLAPIGPMMAGARLRRIVAAAAPLGGEPAPTELRAAARASSLWGPVHSLVGVAVALVALMVYKPGWLLGAVLLLAGFAVGWATGVAVAGRAEQRR